MDDRHIEIEPYEEIVKGGATVLKVGGDNFASGASQKNFLTPHFLASGGGQILLR